MNKNNDFFLDIFNHLLKINEDNILIVFDIDGNIWFSFRDVVKSLGYKNIDNAINTIDVNDLFKQKYKNIRVSCAQETLKNMQPEQMFINESGLYEVLSNSTKPLAKQFMHKYFTDIMPQIRQSGQYIMNSKDKQKLDKMNDKLNNYKQELTYYYDKYHFIPSKAGYLYINLDKSIKNGINITCYKIGYADDMKKRLKEYKVGNFKHKHLCYIPIDINKKEIENCIKARNKPHLTKLITDSICFMSLKDLKEEITDCIKFLKSHICYCLHCKKQYEFNNVTTHKCNKIEKFIDVDVDKLIGKPIGSKLNKLSKSSKKGSKLNKLSKSSKKGSKLNKLSKSSKKGSKLNKLSKSSKKGSKLNKLSKGSNKKIKI
jgi:prophage antirepressor-like protein